ncbi:alpha/beta hydrolase fold protein [Fibrella aestuarina BUZ 2]|uniref:Alpha/beta hydrolase fold protein n=1 Tax=Fibrella aestuarina BUZ 2 TaxID=1166018 RepID=I0K9V3_9BACT|nr:alpha/beta fold hydrolase [Fibrella aestuarina]CCH00906.1 alpha/beta hydrolase fold protein [Fibrella aestuarina BUZ 2]
MKLVFLHYFGGSAASWQYVIDQLTPDLASYALDLPGFGAAPALSAHQTVDDVADAVARQIDGWVGQEPFVLVGHSMGGKIALALAAGSAQRPALAGLQGLVLLAPSPPSPEPIPDETRREMLARPDQTPDERQQTAEKTATTITHQAISPTMRQQIIADNLRASTEAWVAWAAVGSREDITSRMDRIAVPVAILAGDQDEALPASVQPEQVVPWLPQTTLRVVSGVGHLLPYEAPGVVAASIRAMALPLTN